MACLAVIAGAFGAHGIDEALKEAHASEEPRSIAGLTVPASYKYLQDFRTAASYQLTHGIAIFLVGLLGRRGKARVFAHAAGGCFLAGVAFFCGSLYLLALHAHSSVGAVTPTGGVLLVAGWVLLAIAAVMPRSTEFERK